MMRKTKKLITSHIQARLVPTPLINYIVGIAVWFNVNESSITSNNTNINITHPARQKSDLFFTLSSNWERLYILEGGREKQETTSSDVIAWRKWNRSLFLSPLLLQCIIYLLLWRQLSIFHFHSCLFPSHRYTNLTILRILWT